MSTHASRDSDDYERRKLKDHTRALREHEQPVSVAKAAERVYDAAIKAARRLERSIVLMLLNLMISKVWWSIPMPTRTATFSFSDAEAEVSKLQTDRRRWYDVIEALEKAQQPASDYVQAYCTMSQTLKSKRLPEPNSLEVLEDFRHRFERANETNLRHCQALISRTVRDSPVVIPGTSQTGEGSSRPDRTGGLSLPYLSSDSLKSLHKSVSKTLRVLQRYMEHRFWDTQSVLAEIQGLQIRKQRMLNRREVVIRYLTSRGSGDTRERYAARAQYKQLPKGPASLKDIDGAHDALEIRIRQLEDSHKGLLEQKQGLQKVCDNLNKVLTDNAPVLRLFEDWQRMMWEPSDGL